MGGGGVRFGVFSLGSSVLPLPLYTNLNVLIIVDRTAAIKINEREESVREGRARFVNKVKELVVVDLS